MWFSKVGLTARSFFSLAFIFLLLLLFFSPEVKKGRDAREYPLMKVKACDLMVRAQKYSEEEILGDTHESGGFNKMSLLIYQGGFVKQLKKDRANAYVLTSNGLALARALRHKFIASPAATGSQPSGAVAPQAVPQTPVTSSQPTITAMLQKGKEKGNGISEQQKGSQSDPKESLKASPPAKEKKLVEEKTKSEPITEQKPEPVPEPVLEIQEKVEEETQYFDDQEFFSGELEPECLYSNDSGGDGVVLFVGSIEVEAQEKVELPQIFDLLKEKGMTLKTKELKIGDFLWTQRKEGKVDFVLFPFFLIRWC